MAATSTLTVAARWPGRGHRRDATAAPKNEGLVNGRASHQSIAVNNLLETSCKPVDPVVRLRSLIRRKTTEKQRLQEEIEQLDLKMGPLREAAQERADADRQVHERFQQAMAKATAWRTDVALSPDHLEPLAP